ncbi:MAG: metal-sensing transcriptional repressor [Chloroflexota bacterium]|nr:metal-sensing transcriptional repressor [Chloroflexota bacterium]
MLPEVKEEALRRLSYIEGHLAAIKRMVDSEAYCVDILKQSFAVRCAIQKVESLVLDGHLRTHVREGVRKGNEEVLTELLELYNQASK